MHPYKLLIVALAFAVAAGAQAEPNSLGQTGLIHMPDGRVEPDGTARMGVTYMAPYGAIWGSVTLVPWLEVSGRFTRVDDVEAFGGTTNYGDYKDKSFDFKVRLLEETDTRPAVAFGRQDFHGTNLFGASYIAASKAFDFGDLGQFDLSAGYGNGRIGGAFGGVRWRQPWLPDVALVVEYDGFDYHDDFRARRRGEVERGGGLGVGVEYRRGWFLGQLQHQDDHWGFNASLSVPLQQRTFHAKTEEPPPVQPDLSVRHPAEAWQANDPAALEQLLREIGNEGLYVSRVLVDGDRIELMMNTGRYTTIGRVAGRVARLVAAHAPRGVNRLDLTLTDGGLPVITYTFSDLHLMRGWLAGAVSPERFQATLGAQYPDAVAYNDLMADGLSRRDVLGPADGEWRVRVGSPLFAFPMSIYRNVEKPWRLQIRPVNFAIVFNDPNGVVKYDLYAMATASKWLTDSLHASITLRGSWYENVSDTVGTSNSLLPHVRSDFSRYRLEGPAIELDSAYLVHVANPRDRVYTMISGGIFEEAYAGVGGEVLYLPQTGNWAVDFQAYAVRQRDFDSIGFLDYKTITALAGFHYRFPKQGVTVSARGGRFLAKDTGVRFELRRRFLSGFEVGAWYTVTDANDITSPGRPGDPYNDKGIFVRYTIGPMLPFDSDAGVQVGMSPWTRDPGQMVRAPYGLYQTYERRLLLNLEDLGPWSDFGQ